MHFARPFDITSVTIEKMPVHRSPGEVQLALLASRRYPEPVFCISFYNFGHVAFIGTCRALSVISGSGQRKFDVNEANDIVLWLTVHVSTPLD